MDLENLQRAFRNARELLRRVARKMGSLSLLVPIGEMLGSFWDNGKQNGNYNLGFRV